MFVRMQLVKQRFASFFLLYFPFLCSGLDLPFSSHFLFGLVRHPSADVSGLVI